MKLNKMISSLFNLARKLTDIRTLASGDPGRITRRIKNKILGRRIVRKIW